MNIAFSGNNGKKILLLTFSFAEQHALRETVSVHLVVDGVACVD